MSGFCNVGIKTKKYTKSSRSSLANLGKHLLRIDNQDNKLIDVSKTSTNEILIGMEKETLNKSLDFFLDKHELKTRRKDQIQAYQVIFSCDKETFKNEKLLEDWKKETLLFINSNPIFKDNVLLAVFHKDEIQPHIQAVVVPRTKDNRLHFNDLLGGLNGADKLTKLHDDYAKHYTKLGFERGDGSHTNGLDYKHYKKAVSQMTAPVIIPETPKRINPYKEIEDLKSQLKPIIKEAKKSYFLQSQNNEIREKNKKLRQFYVKNREIAKEINTPEYQDFKKQSIEKRKKYLNQQWKLEEERLRAEEIAKFLPATEKIKIIEDSYQEIDPAEIKKPKPK